MSFQSKVLITLAFAFIGTQAQGLWDEVDQASSSSSIRAAQSSSSLKISSSSIKALSSSSVVAKAASSAQLSSSSVVAKAQSSAQSSSSATLSSSAEILPTPSIATPMPVLPSSSSVSSSSSAKLQVDQIAQSQMETPSLADQRALLGKIQVIHVEDFGDYRDYRSPRKALFLSLLLPGWGQAYVGGTSNWVRAALYLGAEVGIAATWYQYSVQGLEDYQAKAKALEKSMWSDSLYENRTHQLLLAAKAKNPEWAQNLMNRYQSSPSRTEWCFALFGNNNTTELDQCMNQSAASFETSFLPKVSNSNFQAFYPNNHSTLIASQDMLWGWRDQSGPQNLDDLKLDQASKISLGSSLSQNRYLSYQKEINSRREKSSTLLGLLALNHLVSALDAALSANIHNRALYRPSSGPKLSLSAPLLWQNQSWTPSLQMALAF